VQLSNIRAGMRAIIVGGLIVGISACGGGGGGSPNPVLGTLTFKTNENVALSGTLTAKDPGGTQVTFSTTSNPASGTLAGLPGTGSFTYTPNPNFTGNDSFGVTATDASGNKTTGTVMITVTVDQAPTASNTIVRSDDGLNINVLTTASDPDKDPLSVTITSGPNVGTAKVNSDGTVTVSGVLKGLVTFGYTVTDPSAQKATANAAVFVGVDPFRAAFVADSATNGSYEVFLTDFAAPPTQISSATQGTIRLKGFAIADTGTTVVYRTQDINSAATTSLSFVRTATPATQVSIPIQSGLVPVLDGQGKDQFVVSPDGNWIALVAGAGNSNSLYVVNAAATPPVVTAVVPTIAGAAATYATQPIFTSDSKSVYFLATSVAGGANRSLFVVSVNSLSAPTTVSSLSRQFTSDDITAYSVAPNQSTIVIQANRGGSVGLYSIDPTKLQTENPINVPPVGAAITSSTVGLPPGLGGSNTGMKVAYDVGTPVVAPESVGIYVGDVPPASPPAPQFVAALEQVIGFSPDDSKLLYTDSSRVFEIASSAGNSGTQLGVGNQGWYDSGGNIVLLGDRLSSGGASLTSNTRPFGTPNTITPSGTAAFDLDVSGVGRGVAIFGQAADNGTAPATANLQLVDVASTNTSPIVLKPSAVSPLDLTTDASKVVTN
jgi:Bacterial Ig domain